MFIAIINQPGYLPETDPVPFDSCAEAWQYLLEELEHDWDAAEENGDWESGYREARNTIYSHDLNRIGSVSAGGYVYSVDLGENETANLLTGCYGIREVPADTPDSLKCGECGRHWADDITPAGRCPFEYNH